MASKAKAQKRKIIAPAKLPAGFKVSVVPSSGGGFHNWEAQAILTGKVTKIFKKKGEYGTQRYLTVKQKNGSESSFSESSSLKNLFDEAKVGKEVYVHYQGTVPLKGGKSYKVFTAGIK